MAHEKESRRERIEALKRKRDEAIKELDALLLDHVSGGVQTDGGGGPGPGDTGP